MPQRRFLVSKQTVVIFSSNWTYLFKSTDITSIIMSQVFEVKTSCHGCPIQKFIFCLAKGKPQVIFLIFQFKNTNRELVILKKKKKKKIYEVTPSWSHVYKWRQEDGWMNDRRETWSMVPFARLATTVIYGQWFHSRCSVCHWVAC